MIAAIRPLIFSIIISCFVIASTSGAGSRQERGQQSHFENLWGRTKLIDRNIV